MKYKVILLVILLTLTACNKNIADTPSEEITSIEEDNNNIELKEDFIEVNKKECEQNLQNLENFRLPNKDQLDNCFYKDTTISNESFKLWLYKFTVPSDWNVFREREILIFHRLKDNSYHNIDYNHHKLSTPPQIDFASIELNENGKELSWACFMEDRSNLYFRSGTDLGSEYQINFELINDDIYANIDVNYLATKTGCLITGNLKHSLTSDDQISDFQIIPITEFWVDSCDLLDSEEADKCRCSAMLFSDGGSMGNYKELRLAILEKIQDPVLKSDCKTEFEKMYEERTVNQRQYFLPDGYEEMYEEILPIVKNAHICKILNQNNLTSSKVVCE